MSRAASAGIAGLCFFGCIVLVALAYAMTWLRVYGPIVREVILATVTPQFVMGMFFMALVACAGAFLISLDRRA